MIQPHNRYYLGCKRALTGALDAVITPLLGEHGLWDVFCGTATVAYHFTTRYGVPVLATDLSPSCALAAKVFLEPMLRSDIKQARQLVDRLNLDLDNGYPERYLAGGYASETWGNRYFSSEDAARIDWVRTMLTRHHVGPVRNAALVSLMYAADKVAQTCGHYDAFKRKELWRKTKPIRLEMPDVSCGRNGKNQALRREAISMAHELSRAGKRFDVAFLDPPYNTRDYGTNYHVLDSLVTWEKPSVSGVTAKPPLGARFTSELARKKTAKIRLAELVSAVPATHVVLTYNDQPNNLVTLDDLREMLSSQGDVEEVRVNHQLISTGTAESKENHEYILVCRNRARYG